MASQSKPASEKWRKLFVAEGQLRSVWQLVLYLPMLAAAAAIIIFPVTTLLRVIGLPASVYTEAPYSIAGLARRTMSVGITISVIVTGTWAWQRFVRKRNMARLGLSLRRGWLSELGIGVFLGISLTGLIFIVELLVGWIAVQGWAWQTRDPQETLAVLYVTIISTIEVAVMEEIVSRGYLLQTLEEWIGLPAAIVLSSLLFGLIHLTNPTASGWANYVIPFTLTLAGVLFAAAYLVRRSLWIPIGLHFAWNLFEYDVFALTGAPPDWATVLVTEVTGPSFWIGLPGSAFGPEVGALGVLAMLLGIGLLWWIRKRNQAENVIDAERGNLTRA